MFSDPIVKEQGRMSSLSGHNSPTPINNSNQLSGKGKGYPPFVSYLS